MPDSNQLLIVDPQNDFCDPDGALFVPGADKDMERLTEFVRRSGPALDDIHVSLDSHQDMHIAHPEFVVDRHGNHPAPFTVISYDEALAGDYRAANRSVQDYWNVYLKTLHDNGRYPYCIWPPHCRIGTEGQAVVPALREALRQWAIDGFATVSWWPKGSAWDTENYSIVKADVPNPDDPTTQINVPFVRACQVATRLYVAGEAGSHCVANTYGDMATEFGDSYNFSQWTLLEDCQSPVPGFEHLQTAAMAEMESKGMKIMTSAEALKELGC